MHRLRYFLVAATGLPVTSSSTPGRRASTATALAVTCATQKARPSDGTAMHDISQRILLVEDDTATAAEVARVLGGVGFVVDRAGSLDDGVAQAKKAAYGLVVL